MSATLEMPVRYAPVVEDEFDDVDGGAIGIGAVTAIIGAVIGTGAALYRIGEISAERAYGAGLRNDEYQTIKWNVRGFALGTLGAPAGGIVMLGFENKFYSLI